ncbi:hypothetical protein [Falsochrobactrum shanghaiense]|uniref:hypothetical protein n=1 Tax=Falsochrobactrum shanghaiense TaxID=2201899 RepID=UPI0013050547|nr:hypothetical protein [Falsochrobactrum shanghaiense]
MTTSEYGQRLRVSKACEILQFSTFAVEQITWETGYGDIIKQRRLNHHAKAV